MSKILPYSFIYFILIIQLGIDHCRCFKVVNFHENCGNTISDEAGELRFDAQEIPSYLPNNKCSVTINPQSDVLKGRTFAFFYFTKFELSEPCENMSVTILDGSLFGGTLLKGLPEYICGHNTTLEGQHQFFTTGTDQFTVTFKGSNSMDQLPGNFTIKFIAFRSGVCSDKGVYQCPNNSHCVASEYVCTDDIKACGSDRSHCELLKVLKQLLESILKIVRDYMWVVALIFALCILKCIYRRKREAICNLKDSICSAFDNRSTRRRSTSRRSSRTSNYSVQLEPVHSAEPSTVLLPRETVHDVLSTDVDESPLFNDVHNLRSDGMNMTSPEMQQTNAPPPSYDDMFRNTNMTSSETQQTNAPPSYDEVIKNTHIYKPRS